MRWAVQGGFTSGLESSGEGAEIQETEHGGNYAVAEGVAGTFIYLLDYPCYCKDRAHHKHRRNQEFSAAHRVD